MGLETFMGPITVAALCRTQEGRKAAPPTTAADHGDHSTKRRNVLLPRARPLLSLRLQGFTVAARRGGRGLNLGLGQDWGGATDHVPLKSHFHLPFIRHAGRMEVRIVTILEGGEFV